MQSRLLVVMLLLGCLMVIAPVQSVTFGCPGGPASGTNPSGSYNGVVNFTVVPEDATISIGGFTIVPLHIPFPVGSDSPDPHSLPMSTGTNTVTITRAGYENYTATVLTCPGKVTEVSVHLVPLTRPVTFPCSEDKTDDPGRGLVFYTTTPEDAMVLIDGKYAVKPVVDSTDRVTGLQPVYSPGYNYEYTGTRHIIFMKAGYQDRVGLTAEVCSGKVTYVNASLVPGSASGYTLQKDVPLDLSTVTPVRQGQNTAIADKKGLYVLTAAGTATTRVPRAGTTTIHPAIEPVTMSQESGTQNTGRQPGTGSLLITTVPAGAEVFIDGTMAGVTPVTVPDLVPGSHDLSLKLNGYIDGSATVLSSEGKTQTYVIALEKIAGGSYGSLSVKTIPGGAAIFLNGNQMGTSETTLTNLDPGSYNLLLKLDGYTDIFTPITITADKTQIYTATFTKSGQSSGSDFVSNILQWVQFWR
jgi:hypothetical protein